MTHSITNSKKSTNKAVLEYFYLNQNDSTITYWRPFRYGSKMYIVTFSFDLYEVSE